MFFDVRLRPCSTAPKAAANSTSSALIIDRSRAARCRRTCAWILRVDGHTDARPVSGAGRFRSNWDLSAARAIAVVRYLIERGVDPVHLVAAGFGEFQPIDPGTGDEANARNRRIELKLTER